MKKRILVQAIAVALFSLNLAANAQESEMEETAELDKLTITGSHIKGVDLEGALPTIVIDRETIDESGADSIVDLLQNLPELGGGTGTFSTSTAGALSNDTPVAAAGVSMRGLGTSSTLTLINGRRVTVSSFAKGSESFVDVNTIPMAAIERIEVLPSGASALYGADAVAGVINIILRDDFDGMELSLSYGDSDADTDESKSNINFVWGASSGNLSATVVLDYFDRNALYDRDRAETRDEIRPRQQGIYPSFNDLFFQLNDQTEQPGEGGCPADQFVADGAFGEYCALDRGDFVSTVDEFESLGTMATLNYRFDNGLRWFNEMNFSRTQGVGTSSPAPFSRAPIDPERMDWPAALVQDIVDDGGVSDFGSYFGFPIYAWGSFPGPTSRRGGDGKLPICQRSARHMGSLGLGGRI